jgi:hypothetical protein
MLDIKLSLLPRNTGILTLTLDHFGDLPCDFLTWLLKEDSSTNTNF